MLVQLEGQVVILDEGHNMEDSAREAASFSVTSTQITDVFDEITEHMCMSFSHSLDLCLWIFRLYLQCQQRT